MKTHIDISKKYADKFEFGPESMTKVNELIAQYPEGKQKSAILAILHLVQEEIGWLTINAMDYVAGILDIKPIEVYEVATFYTMFHIEPVGNYVLEVCRTGPCMLVGSDQLIQHLENKLAVKVGETSSDGMFTLKTVECMGACGYGPMFQCKGKNYENLTTEKVDELIEQFRNEAKS
jgi:NADH-quinone oxidoreductase subunit E